MERVTVEDITRTGTAFTIEYPGSIAHQIIANQAATLANNPDYQKLVRDSVESIPGATPEEAAQKVQVISDWVERQYPHGINAAIPSAAHSAVVEKIRSKKLA